MSAYALPGFFPPISSPTVFESESESGESSCPGVPEHETKPLHEEGTTLSGILKAGVDRFCPPLLSSSSQKKSFESEEEKPGIQVKEAKIDPVRLVKCVTQSPRSQTQQNRKHIRPRNSKERLTESPQKTPGGKSDADEKTSSIGSPHDEAIEFELSISFDGRKYTATRTMQCIIQLRDDLISEMNNRKRWLQMRASESPFGASDEDGIHFQIPEIPPMTVSAGFVGRGFTMLHAMVTSYVPAMDRWLRNVMAVVPEDSECLMNFLWEPLPNEWPPLSSKSCTSLATLGSIKELDYCTDDSDSEDEWEG